MDSSWPWLALVGAGALHGLHPGTCGLLALAWRGGSGASTLAGWRALPWLLVGHLVSVGLLGITVANGAALRAPAVIGIAAGLTTFALALHCWKRAPSALRTLTGPAGLVLGSFVMAGLQGTGLVLVPALMPLCASAAGASLDSAAVVGLALAGWAVHLAAMLATSGLLVAGGAHGIAWWRRRGVAP